MNKPRKPKKRVKHPDLWTLRVPRSLREEVAKIAKAADSDASKYVRQAVREKIARDRTMLSGL